MATLQILKNGLVFVVFAVCIRYYYDTPLQNCEEKFGGKVVVITGSSSGIGEEAAYQAARCHADLVLVARRRSRLLQVRENALKLGSRRVEVIAYDFSNTENIKVKVVEMIAKKMGRIDHLILNHAIQVGKNILMHIDYLNLKYLSTIMNINVHSHVEIFRQSLPYLEARNGSVVVTSSIFGETPAWASAVYAATKHALNGYFYSIQQQLLLKNSSVAVVVANIGWVRTPAVAEYLDSGYVPVHSFFQGTLEGCAKSLVDSLEKRMRTLNYPLFGVLYNRIQWYIDPSFHLQYSDVPDPDGISMFVNDDPIVVIS